MGVCVQNRLRSKSDISAGQKGLLGHCIHTTTSKNIISFGSRFSGLPVIKINWKENILTNFKRKRYAIGPILFWEKNMINTPL